MTNQKAIEQIKGIWYAIVSLGEADTFPGGRESIFAAITALEQTTWVPVGERLPEEEGEYLVTYKDDGRHGWLVCAEYWEGIEWYGICMDNVVAWQPLPEAYKEDINGLD